MGAKWYNSIIGPGLSLGILFLGLGLGVGSCCYLGSEHYYNPQNLPQVQEMRVDGHDVKFYTLDKKMAVTDVDKEPILDFVKKH